MLLLSNVMQLTLWCKFNVMLGVFLPQLFIILTLLHFILELRKYHMKKMTQINCNSLWCEAGGLEIFFRQIVES